jgi:hypothetical protein
MKWFIYFLLIFNIGFAAWHFRGIDSGADRAADALDVNNESQLILLSELKQQQALKSSAGGKLCYSLGPFTNKIEADNAQELLKEEKVESKSISLMDTSRSGYLVMLPASDSRKEVNQHIKKLKKLKIKDFSLIMRGSRKNAISLGVFSQKKLARRRVDDMIRHGFIPRMETVALPRKVYWVNWYKDSPSQPKESTITDFKKHYSRLSKVERSCK